MPRRATTVSGGGPIGFLGRGLVRGLEVGRDIEEAEARRQERAETSDLRRAALLERVSAREGRPTHEQLIGERAGEGTINDIQSTLRSRASQYRNAGLALAQAGKAEEAAAYEKEARFLEEASTSRNMKDLQAGMSRPAPSSVGPAVAAGTARADIAEAGRERQEDVRSQQLIREASQLTPNIMESNIGNFAANLAGAKRRLDQIDEILAPGPETHPEVERIRQSLQNAGRSALNRLAVEAARDIAESRRAGRAEEAQDRYRAFLAHAGAWDQTAGAGGVIQQDFKGFLDEAISSLAARGSSSEVPSGIAPTAEATRRSAIVGELRTISSREPNLDRYLAANPDMKAQFDALPVPAQNEIRSLQGTRIPLGRAGRRTGTTRRTPLTPQQEAIKDSIAEEIAISAKSLMDSGIPIGNILNQLSARMATARRNRNPIDAEAVQEVIDQLVSMNAPAPPQSSGAALLDFARSLERQGAPPPSPATPPSRGLIPSPGGPLLPSRR